MAKGKEKNIGGVNIITGRQAIEKAILSIQRRGKKLDEDIHVAALSCLSHYEEHKDYTLITERLFKAMPKGSRANALKEWVEAHSMLRYDKDANDGKGAWKHDKSKAFKLEDAAAHPWWDFKPEAPYTGLSFAKATQTLYKRMVKAANSGKAEDKVTTANVEAFEQMMIEQGIEVPEVEIASPVAKTEEVAA